MTIESTEGDAFAAYGATLGPTATDELVFTDEFASEAPNIAEEWENDLLARGHRESKLHDAPPDTATARALQRLSGFGSYHFHDTSPNSPLHSNARAIDHRQLHPDGANLAAYLLFLRQSQDLDHKAAWTLLTGLLGQIAPFIRELDPTPVNADPRSFRLDAANGSIDKVTIRLDWIDDAGNRFGMHQLSDGTLRALALFAALTQPGTSLPQELRPRSDLSALLDRPGARGQLVEVAGQVGEHVAPPAGPPRENCRPPQGSVLLLLHHLQRHLLQDARHVLVS